MADHQTGLNEAVQVGRAMASISGAVKGATAGPFGAVIGAAIQNRETLKKAVAGIVSLLLIPVLFIVMLPGLVFGNLSENTGALTSNSRINENIRAANEAIVEVLQECHDEVLADVNAAASRVPEVMPYPLRIPMLTISL